MTEQKLEIPNGLRVVGKLFLNILLFIVYAILFQLVIGFALGFLEGAGVFEEDLLTGDGPVADTVYSILALISILVSIALIFPKETKFYFPLGIKKGDK